MFDACRSGIKLECNRRRTASRMYAGEANQLNDRVFFTVLQQFFQAVASLFAAV
jgi:hypothetical protein